MSDEPSRGPEPLGEIISRLFAERGWARKQDRLRLERAWVEAVGPELARHTQPLAIRRGVLEVVVGNAVLLQELSQFHRRTILHKLRAALTGVTITDLRFRAGVVRDH
jgi:predicted nucleic acid-binding Zn ribbon protein